MIINSLSSFLSMFIQPNNVMKISNIFYLGFYLWLQKKKNTNSNLNVCLFTSCSEFTQHSHRIKDHIIFYLVKDWSCEMCAKYFISKMNDLVELRLQQNSDKERQPWGELTQTSKVISRVFLGTCRTPVSASSPETQTQGLAVNMDPLSFLLGTTTTW